MSPIPSPTPVRTAILRMMFSPAGLLFGFVVLIIATCPGAKGADVIQQMIVNDALLSRVASTASPIDTLPASLPAAPDRVIGRSTRFDRPPISSARSKTPAERAASIPVTGTSEPVRNARSVLPLLSADLQGDAARASTTGLVPMTGPAVGIRPRLPTAGR